MSRSFAPRWPSVSLALFGLGLSILLEVVHYRAFAVPTASSLCEVGTALDCARVALSPHAVFLGLPLPFWGAAGFTALLSAIWLRSAWRAPLALVAALSSVVLLVVQFVAVGAGCLLCEGVHLASLGLLAVTWRELPRSKGRAEPETWKGWLAALGAALWKPRELPWVFGLPLLLLLVGRFGIPAYWGAFGWKGEPPFAHGVTEEGYPWIGASTPELTLEEFTDYACPYCNAATRRVLTHMARHPGQLRLVRRQDPRMECRAGMQTHCQFVRAAYCAGEQGRFWQADRWLFEHAIAHEVDLEGLAVDLDLDLAALGACFIRPDTFERGAFEARAARKLRIPGTPHYKVEDELFGPVEAARRLRAL